MKNRFSILVLSLVSIAAFCLSANAQTEKRKVLDLSNKVVIALKSRDMKRLATYVHPIKGVRFSPYGYINKKHDQVFKNNQLSGLLKSKRVYIWGEFDESEEVIKLTFLKYYTIFVYDEDFAKPDHINYNLKKNNGVMINNIAETYPKGVEVEYFIDGTDEKMYASLRLVYERMKNNWYLVGVVRDTPGI